MTSPRPAAHQLQGRGGVEKTGQQPQDPQNRHPGPAQVDEGPTAGHPQGQEPEGQAADGRRTQLLVLDHPAAAAEGSEVQIQGIAAEGVVVVVDEVGPQVQGGHPQGVEQEKTRCEAAIDEIRQGRPGSHRE